MFSSTVARLFGRANQLLSEAINGGKSAVATMGEVGNLLTTSNADRFSR
jgi:hypothetical protein